MRILSVVALLILLLVPLGAAAETVMLYTEEPVGKGEYEIARGYMEDGIMGSFFDAGHIIFNTHAAAGSSAGDNSGEEASGEDEPFEDRKAFRIAKAGGAGYLLEIMMKFTEDEEELLPQSVEYRVYLLKEDALLGEGTVHLRNAGDSDELSNEELLKNMGRNLAQGALSRL